MAVPIKFVNIGGCTITYAVSPTGLAARHFEIALLVKQTELFGR